MRRWLALGIVVLLAVGSATAGNGEMFLSIYGGYGYNDSSLDREPGEEGVAPYATGRDSIPYGIVWGGETPVAGGSIALQFNQLDDIRMDTLMFSIMLNFASHDTRKGIGRVIYNRASGYILVGAGMMRYSDPSDTDYVFAGQLGIGGQFKFNRTVGFRWELTGIGAPRKSLINTQATMGLAFYW